MANAERNSGDAAMRPACMHPNDVDRKRIERALASRARYRYVSPQVRGEEGGYWIQSPCCSRNVDPDGGVIDIARLEYVNALQAWRLYRKDHAQREWQLYAEFGALSELLQLLNQDPDRIFWQ
jgi:hypothetical protein